MRSPVSIKPILIFMLSLLVLGGIYFVLIYSTSPEGAKFSVKEDTLIARHSNENLPLDADDPIWKSIEPVKIHLYPQAARVPYGTEERDVWVRSVHSDSVIAFLLEYADNTENRDIPLTPDACAIMLTAEDSPATSQMMGQGSTANIWQWQASRDFERYYQQKDTVNAVRELIASGPGTQSPMNDQKVKGKGEYQNNKWRVIMKRQLQSQQEGEVEFIANNNLKIAFAIWDGAEKESLGMKSISILGTLILERNRE